GEVLVSPTGRAAITHSITVSKDFRTTQPSELVQASDAVPAGEVRVRYPYTVETTFDPTTGQTGTGSIHFSLRVPEDNVKNIWQISRPNRGFGWVCFTVGLFLTGLGTGLTVAHEAER